MVHTNQVTQGVEYDGTFYAAIGDFIREKYLDWGFTKGTKREVDFLVEVLALPPGARILDVGCGVGRHSLELARRGYATLGIDVSQGLIDVALQIARTETLNATFVQGDARALQYRHEFDAAICICEGAFGLAGSDAGHKRILAGIAAALKPGAPFILTAVHSFASARRLDRSLEGTFDPYTGTESSLETITNPAGGKRQVTIHTTAFTYRELNLLLQESGFEVEGGYGCEAGSFARKPLEIDDFELMMVARRTG